MEIQEIEKKLPRLIRQRERTRARAEAMIASRDEELRAFLHEAHKSMTVVDLARVAGVSRVTIYKWLR